MEIKHTKGRFLAIFICLILVLTILSAGVGIVAAADPIVSIKPAVKEVNVGEDFSVFIEVDPNGNAVETALLDLTYDPAKVSITEVVMNGVDFPINFPGETPVAGKITKIMGLNTAATGLTTVANLAEIQMHADAAGTFTVGISGDLTKPQGDPLTPVTMNSGEVRIEGTGDSLGVTVLYPNGWESIQIGTQVQVSARATDGGAVTGVTFYYSTGTNWNSIGAGTRVSGTDKDGTWDITWDTDGLGAGTNYKIKAVASDGTSTRDDQSDSAFSLTPSSTLWQGDVTLINGTTFITMAHNSGKSYETNRITALGALDAASKKGDFNYAVSDEWYAAYGSFLVDSIADVESTGAEYWMYWVNYPNVSIPVVGVNQYDVKEGDVVTYYYGDWYVTPANASKVLKIQVHVQIGSPAIFDTGAPMNPYPSIPGTHTGTITPSQDITVQKLYTYPCAGTGGHTESVRIYGNGKDESASWNGYTEDRDAITFDSSFTLESGKTYSYEIITGSYPQIHHTKELQTDYGWINCTKFTDANGKEYDDWIPAIRLGT